MGCPNINSPQWKNLVAKIGVFEAMKEFIRNNEEIPSADNYEETFKGVNATMKIVTALQKTPRTTYSSNNIQGFYNDLIKQGAPKNQIELLQDYISRNNITEININDLIIGLLSEMNYIVEINTTKDKVSYRIEPYREFDPDTYTYEDVGYAVYPPHSNEPRYIVKTKEEAERLRKEEGNNSKYYSNLTVNEDFYKNNPDWEYKEQRITTPLITPSIKGHAQFAESNDIGWFRAWYNKKTGEVHVLEVQSDLFQKGRNKENLINEYSEEYQSIDGNTIEEIIEKRKNIKSNQFLQLLNKDNNWVTFFVKSIIQDSAKKGYEKVLFPTGNTASKVEGHSTLEEFKKQKEDRIKELETKIQNLKNSKQFQKLTPEEKAKTIEQVTKEHRSITALKDLTHKLAHRIGGTVKFENNPNADWKGYNQGMTSVLNEAYMTPDTPFHEILAHPIIRAIKSRDGNYELNKLFEQKRKLEKLDKNTNLWEIGDNWVANQFQLPFRATVEWGLKEINSKIEYLKKDNLYQSLLKELETGRGREVFEQVKRDYKYKEFNKEEVNKLKLEINDFENDLEIFKDNSTYLQRTKEKIRENQERIKYLQKNNSNYTLEEQQEEAIVTLLGMMAADKLDAKKDATLISKLKELWKQISDFVKSLLKQDGIKIDELPITTTLNDLAEIMAYGNNKIILPGYKVEYSTPLGNKYDTLEEVNQEIRDLVNSDVEVDLSGVKIPDLTSQIENLKKQLKDFEYEIEPFNDFVDVYTTEGRLRNNEWTLKADGTEWYSGKENKTLTKDNYKGFVIQKGNELIKISKEKAKEIYYAKENNHNTATQKSRDLYAKLETELHFLENLGVKGFIEKNKEYEQSKEIIEQWKKENNIQYDPEEVYSRGQGFYSSIGAYSNLELDLLLKNLIQHIEDNKKAGGEFTISAFTKPIDKRLKHIEGTGDRVRFVIYPKSEHIKWAAPTDVYSGSVWDAHEKVSKDKKSELLGVSFTKAPALKNINEVSPNLADIIDNLSHVHNELGIELTANNFRIEYDDNIDYSTKKLIDNINKILDNKYGKLVKPEIKPQINKEYNFSDGTVIYEDEKGKYKYEEDYEEVLNDEGDVTDVKVMLNEKRLSEFEFANILNRNEGIYTTKNNLTGKQPTQTRENTTSIESVKDKIVRNTDRFVLQKHDTRFVIYDQIEQDAIDVFDNEKDAKEAILKLTNQEGLKEEEYTSQALTNLKIAALKEVARKYPRSLITSKVVPINPNVVDNSEIQYSKVENIQDLQNEINQLKQELERVEKEGFAALRPIYKFYEETIGNILKKQGFNPIRITDEYDNSWYEIKLTSDIAKEFISMHKSEDNSIFKKQILKYLQDKGIISSKEFPAKSGNFYIKKTIFGQDRNFYAPEEVERRNLQKINDINQKLGFDAISTVRIGNGLVVKFNSQLSLFDRFDEELLTDPEVTQGDREYFNENIFTTNARDLVDNVYRVALMINKPDLINIGTILKQNEDLLAGVGIELLTELQWAFLYQNEENETSAAYYANENSIQFSQKHLDARSVEKNIRVIMEELLHALTVQPFHKQDNNIKLNPKEQKFVDSINKLYNYYKENAPRYLKESYRFTNAREFIIGMTLDPNFKDHLEQIDKPGFFQKLITDFVNAILQFFGIKTNKEIYPFEKLTLNYINDYISSVKEIRPLLITESGDLISGAKDIRTEKEELKKNLTEEQKNKIKERIKTFLNQIKSISGTSRFSNPEIKNAIFHIYKDYEKFNESDIDMIDFFFNFTREINSIFDSLDRQIESLNNSRIPLTENQKLSKWNRIISTARDFDSTLEEFRKIKAELFKDELVAKEIEKLIVKRASIEDRYFFGITPLVVTHLSDIIEPATEKALAYLDDEIDQLSKRVDLATKSGAEKRAKDLKKTMDAKIKERNDKYNITKDKVQDYIRGLLGDSNTLSSFLEASIVSSNPIVSGLTKYIKDNLHKSDSNILQTANETQTEIDKYEKDSGISRNNLEAFNRPLLDTYDIIESIDDEGNFTYKKELALLSPWNMDYIKELQKFTFINGQLRDKIKNAKTEPETLELKKLQKENTIKRLQFLRDYMEMPYLNEVHEAMDLIHEDLGGYTAFEAIGQLYDEKERIEEEIERTKDEDVKDILYNNLDDVEFRIKEIRSTYEKDPDSKEYKIAAQLRKRDEALKKYRKFVLTTAGEAKFKLEKERIEKAFEDGEITQKDKDYWYQHNTVSTLTDEYWQTKLSLIGEMNDLLSQMSTKQEKSEDIGKLYNEIENIVKPYRDANGVINGNAFNQKQVADIRELEEKIEKFKDGLANIFGLSRNERVELANLNEELQNNDVESQTESDPQRQEFLRNEQIRIEQRINTIQGKKKTFNKKLVNKYFDLMKKLSALDTTTNTHYYEQRHQEEYDKYIDSQSLKGMTDKFTYNGTTYEKISSQWYAKTKDKTQKITKKEAEKMFKTKRGDLSFDQSEWFKNNHIKRLKWVKSDRDYDPYDPYAVSGYWEESFDPIYIWRQTNPTDPKHKISGQPSLKYKRSIIKNGKNDKGIPDGSEDYTNPNYKVSINGYNTPRAIGAKDNRYINQRYLEMSASDDKVNKARFRYLKYQTELYFKSQIESFIPKTMRPGYNMPSIRPSGVERFQATSVSDKISEVGQWFRGVKDETVTNEQDKDILYGYLDNKGMIPMKFLGDIDIEDQSIDIARSIGMFYIAAQQRARLAETYSLVTSTADILAQTENTPVKTKDGKVVSVAKKYLGKNTTVAKHIAGSSNTLKQVNEMINTFYFGERIKDEKGSKQLNTVLGLGANLMLGLNFGSMIQNWSNAKIQSILETESKLTKNFNMKDWTKAEATYWAHIAELMGDLGKYGNKSYINQFIDYFGGINFNIINIFDTTSAYKGLTKTAAKVLMPTEMAEHQLSYVLFMSIAMNTKVNYKVGDEIEQIPLFDAFRIGDKGLELKEGVELSQAQKDEFINKVNSSARRINGEYGNLDSPIAQKYMMGRLFLFMNKYAVPFFMRRFGKRRFNIQDGIQDDGFWRLFFRTLGHDIKQFQLNIVRNWKYYTPSQKAAIKQVSTEISVSIILISMIAMLGGDDDKELKDNGLLANNIIYVLKGIKRQNEQFMLVPGLGLDDVYNRIKNPFPIATKLGQTFAVMNDLVYLAGYSMGYNELKDIEYTKKSGWHSKGDLKIWNDLGKLFSLPNKLNQYLHPDIAIKNLNAYRIK